MNYLARTTPPEFTQTAACDFDKAVVDTIGATCNVVLSDMQRTKAGFSTKEGGLGLRTIADKTEAAYIASRNATHILCTQIRHCHRGDQNPRDQHLQSAIDAWISWCRGWMWLRWSLTISLKVCSTNGSMRRT